MVAGRRDNYFKKKKKMPDGGYTGDHGRRLCSRESCTKAATYGKIGESRATSCAFHRTPDMVDIVNRKCAHGGCEKQPSFGFPSDGSKPSRCADHKLDGMINLLARICTHEGCRTRPSYGFVGGKASKCVRHREKGMVSHLAGKKTCEVGGCTVSPSFGFEGPSGPVRCKAHALDGMKRVRRKTGEPPNPSEDRRPDEGEGDRAATPPAFEAVSTHPDRTAAWIADLRMSDALGEMPEDTRHAMWDWIGGPGPTEAEARCVVDAANAVARAFSARQATLDCRREPPTWHDLALTWRVVTGQLPTGSRGWIDPITGDGLFVSSLKHRMIPLL